MTQIAVDRAVLENALEALEDISSLRNHSSGDSSDVDKAAHALRKAIFQAALEAEPTWTHPVEYTPPHMGRKPLTGGQRIQIMERLGITVYGPAAEAVEALIQEVEAAHGITAHTIEHDPAKIRAAFEEDDFQAGAV